MAIVVSTDVPCDEEQVRLMGAADPTLTRTEAENILRFSHQHTKTWQQQRAWLMLLNVGRRRLGIVEANWP